MTMRPMFLSKISTTRDAKNAKLSSKKIKAATISPVSAGTNFVMSVEQLGKLSTTMIMTQMELL